MAGFIPADIKSLFNNNQSVENNPKQNDDTKNENGSSNTQKDQKGSSTKNNTNKPKTFEAWGNELNKRLAENRKYSAQARRSEYDIESEFFKEFFDTMWDADCAKQLYLIGDKLRKAIKVYGFNKKFNPILAFISDRTNYVQNKLIKTRRLNSNSFNAIYQAVADNLVADSEFFKPNSYNIIYNPTLYTKPANEILEYINLQKKILVASENRYLSKTIALNKKVFLVISNEQNIAKLVDDLKQLDVSEIDIRTTKLNNIKLAKELSNKLGNVQSNKQYDQLDDKSLHSILGKLKRPSEKYAMLSMLYMLTRNKKAKDAISSGKFDNVKLDDTAMTKVAGIITDRPDNSSVNKLVDAIMNNLGY